MTIKEKKAVLTELVTKATKRYNEDYLIQIFPDSSVLILNDHNEVITWFKNFDYLFKDLESKDS